MLLVSHPDMLGHDMGPGEVERPPRLTAVVDALAGRSDVVSVDATPVPLEALARVHPTAWIETVLACQGRRVQLGPDARTSPGSVAAALLAAGAARDATLAVLDGPHRHAFAAVRPPGHHAGAAYAMGFCFFNNVVVAAEAARQERGIERVLIVDWDVHHGNGTEDLVLGRDGLLFFSTHQGFGFYPGTGARHRDNCLNVPLRAGAGDAELLDAFQGVLRSAAAAFRPQLVLVSAGFDAHVDDPLGGLCATAAGFGALCAEVRAIADAYADGRVVLLLEGGYDLGALGTCAAACADALRADPARTATGPR